jgi:hypothetical protein
MYGTVLCTCWVLGGDDVYLLQDPPVSLDRPMYSLYVVCAVQFLLDLLMRSMFEPGYRLSFYFWLDVIALASLAPEVVFVVASFDLFDLGVASLARSGRAASAGARVVRILRIMRLLKQVAERVIQIVCRGEYPYLPTYLYTYIPTYLYTYIPIYLYTYIPIYLYTNIPIRTPETGLRNKEEENPPRRKRLGRHLCVGARAKA